MNLIIFDIDGTLVDSVVTDDQCFIRAFADLYGIDLSGIDWSTFKHVTDSGLTRDLFKIHLGKEPTEQEICALKKHFYDLLHMRKSEMTEIRGARKALTMLEAQPEIALALGTGGWEETAKLKLSILGYEPLDLPLVTANHHISRIDITRQAIQESLIKEQVTSFDSITIIGDGLWDLRTAQDLGINFIGIDYHSSAKLVEAGARNVMTDLTRTEQIMEWVLPEGNM